MDAVREDLCQRAKELRSYLRHVGDVSETARSGPERAIASSLRAAAYLITYNMVEATARNAVCAVFDRLKDEAISFDRLTIQLKRFLLAHARRKKPEELADAFTSIANDIVVKVFEPSDLFSGNVDARTLRRTAKQIGYKLNSTTRKAEPALLAVKNNRNDLAHGNKTFSEVGRDATVPDLRRHANQAILYMCEVMRNVERFVKNREYLSPV
jgi:hypothetical protein